MVPLEEAAKIRRQHADEVASGNRFEFGKNWTAFLSTLNEDRIEDAVKSLKSMLEVDRLDGLRFIDVGSGSGLFSLAARRLGAKTFSFDYDTHSTNCTLELRRRYYPDDPDWIVESGSVLDKDYLGKLGKFDIVYSWGVLHHTGNMWQALENIIPLVDPRGKIYIALYNDQGSASRRWLWVKRNYCKYPLLRYPFLLGSFGLLWWRSIFKDLLLLRPGHSFRQVQAQPNRRGMTIWYDVVDWVGGYPFEVAKVEEVFDFYRQRGFVLTKVITDCNLGCNQFVFLNLGQVL